MRKVVVLKAEGKKAEVLGKLPSSRLAADGKLLGYFMVHVFVINRLSVP